MANSKAERAPWGDFPPVVRNGDLGDLDKQPEYLDAKKGSATAALAIAQRLITPEMLNNVKNLIGDNQAKIVPVLATENAGNNKIPLAMAAVLANRLGLEVEYDIVQSEKVGRTGKGAFHRLAMSPKFEGNVERDQSYLIVDDTLSMGGTLASLRGYIENRAGKVLGAAVMTAHPAALDITLKPKLSNAMQQKHGPELDDYWRKEFGYSVNEITQGEAGHLRKAPSLDAIRDRITEARNEAGWTVDESRTGETKPEESRRIEQGPFKSKADDFKNLPDIELTAKYPNDQSILDARAAKAIAYKFAKSEFDTQADQDRFMSNVQEKIANNLEHGRENAIPKILEDRAKSNEQER
ncbi:phosphoribosyltransferase [Vibrio parahaemolyticus]|uniref:phosphoribosyltransferase n=1 Tax=Vibrio parahaemolyticus TaxID=670 RepID=UPI0004134DDE|nr:phosphoribosyltransferase [Vibrio parahaemolyticus]HCE5184934.1 phosphoribosyltransferase [Vibrio parahaemolyticus]